MIITFCGHAKFPKTEEYEQKIVAFLEEKVGDQPVEIYLGGYGDFDGFAYDYCRKYKERCPKITLGAVLIRHIHAQNAKKSRLSM